MRPTTSRAVHVAPQALATMFAAAGIPGVYGADGNAVSLREGRQIAVV
jgi:hypothetical protein